MNLEEAKQFILWARKERLDASFASIRVGDLELICSGGQAEAKVVYPPGIMGEIERETDAELAGLAAEERAERVEDYLLFRSSDP